MPAYPDDGMLRPDDFVNFGAYMERMTEWREDMEDYLDRIDANAKRLKYNKVTERVAQGAIRDQIKSLGYTANMEVKPCENTLRRMDIYGDCGNGRQYVVEVKMGFDDWIGAVAQLNYYCHLLTKAGKKPSCLILAFHCEDSHEVPFEIFSYCDEESIIACKAEVVGKYLESEIKHLIACEKHFAEHSRAKDSPQP